MYLQIEDKFYLIDFGTEIEQNQNTKRYCFAGTPILAALRTRRSRTQSDNRTDIYAIGMLMKFMLTKNTDKKSKIRGRLGKIIKKCNAK